MRSILVLLSSVVLATAWITITAPTAEAMIYCVQKVKEPVATDRCDGIVCLGYNQSGWQNCVPPEIYCLHTDCCGTTNTDFYCPEPY